jgi:uncharacterized protein (TIGR02001 family)
VLSGRVGAEGFELRGFFSWRAFIAVMQMAIQKGTTMKLSVLSTALALAMSATAASAADLPVKAPVAAAPASPWDVAFGAAVMSDYNFRGITQSNHRASVNAYFEPRYNINPNLQLYAGIGGYSIEFPNNAAAEIDFYGGIRPTLGKLALDFGVWYYWYPGGRTFPGGAANLCANLVTPPCNVIKGDLSFVEVYGKATYTFNDNWSAGMAVYYDPDWLNSGADGVYLYGTGKYTGAALANGVGWYASGEIARYWLGTTDLFYGNINLPDYTTWSVGLGFTWKVFTLDLRYYDTDLSKTNCNVLTSDHTSGASGQSNWCGSTFIAALKADLSVNSNLK